MSDQIIVYTTEQGGFMKMQPWWGTEEDFQEAKRTGRLRVNPEADTPVYVNLAMVALCDVRELHDFRLGHERTVA